MTALGPMIQRGVRCPQPRDPEPLWTAARYVSHDRPCSFCGFTIHRDKPGNSKGTLGTKAYVNMQLQEWECIPCRQEALRALAALEAGQ